MRPQFFLCLVAAAVACPLFAQRPGPPGPKFSRMSYLDNGTIRLGVDLDAGGAITYLSRSGVEENVINTHDFGREVQMSFYAGPIPFAPNFKSPAKRWQHIGWNANQAGDCFGNPSKLVETRNDGKSLYVKCVPMQWGLDGVLSECTIESMISLEGVTAVVTCRLNNHRSDSAQYQARTQEMPALFTNAPYSHLMTYTGERPFTGDELKEVLSKGRWLSTECWSAHVDGNGWGLGVWNPMCYRFSGAFTGQAGPGTTSDNATGYMAPSRQEVIDANIQYQYTFVLILGTVTEIRKYVYAHAARPGPPRYRFQNDRQGWTFIDGVDGGWPVRGELSVSKGKASPEMIGPATFWRAADGPIFQMEAAFHSSSGRAKLYWAPFSEQKFSERDSVSFPVVSDGEFHINKVNLATSPYYRGNVVGVRLDPLVGSQAGDWVRVRSISFTRD
jgi:hypothetical protein